MVVAYNMGEWHQFVRLRKWPKSDAAVFLTAFGLTVVTDLTIAVEIGMDAALQAHFGRAAVNRLDDAPLHLLDLDEIRLAAQVERERALRERAELAAERAHVRVVDVAVADERHFVAGDLPA